MNARKRPVPRHERTKWLPGSDSSVPGRIISHDGIARWDHGRLPIGSAVRVHPNFHMNIPGFVLISTVDSGSYCGIPKSCVALTQK